jgi:hypothetical protein
MYTLTLIEKSLKTRELNTLSDLVFDKRLSESQRLFVVNRIKEINKQLDRFFINFHRG